MGNELKPCPLCGSEKVQVERHRPVIIAREFKALEGEWT